ncbi:sodium:solute symporter, partial [candidate division KSB1 bacterium]|nr:sodium:solute symporter [candidate division KSB1 bacterium]
IGKKQRNTRDYFLGDRNLPWTAVCFSVVATETSTLTFISIPGLAYLTNLNFLQITLGFLLGRIFISYTLLPAYYRGELYTAYELLGNRFGSRMRKYSSTIFQITRLLADGVRLFATAIPLAVITGLDYSSSILIIAVLTILYTYIGGIRAVVWMDVIQMFIYIGGALLAAVVLLRTILGGWPAIHQTAGLAGKWQLIDLGLHGSIADFFSTPYTLIGGLLTGAFFSMASHGTDQLIVQRLLACKSLQDSRKALITSGFLVIAQFSLFLFLGVLLYVYYQGAAQPSDEVLPRFIVEGLPAGVSGIIIAGVFAAAMSTLSGSLNSLASASMLDIYKSRWGKSNTEKKDLRVSRLLTFFWGIVFIGGAMLFKDKNNPVVELGLAIASFTYGGLLGAFFLGTYCKRATEDDALIALWGAIFFMTWVIDQQGATGFVLAFLNLVAGTAIFFWLKKWRHRIFIALWSALLLILMQVTPAMRIAYPWYVLIGTTISLLIGIGFSRFSERTKHI